MLRKTGGGAHSSEVHATAAREHRAPHEVRARDLLVTRRTSPLRSQLCGILSKEAIESMKFIYPGSFLNPESSTPPGTCAQSGEFHRNSRDLIPAR